MFKKLWSWIAGRFGGDKAAKAVEASSGMDAFGIMASAVGAKVAPVAEGAAVVAATAAATAIANGQPITWEGITAAEKAYLNAQLDALRAPAVAALHLWEESAIQTISGGGQPAMGLAERLGLVIDQYVVPPYQPVIKAVLGIADVSGLSGLGVAAATRLITQTVDAIVARVNGARF